MSNDENLQELGGVSRRSMIAGSAGFASALAAAVMAPGMAAAGSPAQPTTAEPADRTPVPVATPDAEIPEDTVVACIRHAERGEITIITGETERTFHEPALAKRLLQLAEAS